MLLSNISKKIFFIHYDWSDSHYLCSVKTEKPEQQEQGFDAAFFLSITIGRIVTIFAASKTEYFWLRCIINL